MNDAVIFGLGVVVTLMVGGAVGLLLWGAANEPDEAPAGEWRGDPVPRSGRS